MKTNRIRLTATSLLRDVTKKQADEAIKKANLPLFEIARLFVRLDHLASIMVNADQSITAFESYHRTE